jgi:hypothetical protein
MIVKFSDILQAISYTVGEYCLGNTYLKWITDNAITLLKDKFWNNKYFSSYVKEVEVFIKQSVIKESSKK